ncbi:MAG: anthranilate synthase component I [Sphaerobacteraceae bacterium]|nr:MAG: anthranilate synthase component I [Sphaerobacteraceae bacterium]
MVESKSRPGYLAATMPERYSPSLDEVRSLSSQGNVIPVYREILADLETPVSAYLKVAQGPYSFLLESIEGGERLARYSFIATDPFARVTLKDGVADAVIHGESRQIEFDDPLVALRDLLGPYQTVDHPKLPRFLGGAVGYLSYESVRYFEKLPVAPNDPHGFPDGFFQFVDSMLVFDHVDRTIKVVSHVHVSNDVPLEESYRQATERIDQLIERLHTEPEVPVSHRPVHDGTVDDRMRVNMTRQQYDQMVERAKEYIYNGDIIQVVLSQRVEVDTGAHPFNIYRALRRVNPSPYMFYLNMDDVQIVGASPELLVRLEGDTLTNHPIAGTRHRGADDAEDDRLAEDLAGDEKERAEHIMLVDLGRNDIGRVAAPGTVNVPKLMEIERYSHVMHLVSNVQGKIAEGKTGLDALRSCFPAGTVSGAPKIRAMEIIAELEPDRRGPYSGCVGYVDFSGNLDTAITLRTMIVKDGTALLQAGGGIVADSTPEFEFNECFHKMRALMRSIEFGEQIERIAREERES